MTQPIQQSADLAHAYDIGAKQQQDPANLQNLVAAATGRAVGDDLAGLRSRVARLTEATQARLLRAERDYKVRRADIEHQLAEFDMKHGQEIGRLHAALSRLHEMNEVVGSD